MRKPIHQLLGKSLRVLLLLALLLPYLNLAGQQCPSIINCPQSTPTYCDESANQAPLWNDAPFTFSPTIGDADLHEGEIDLNIKVKGCSGGGLSTISFLLYLDLDNDGLQETVLKSGSMPPAGRVMANNSFNPGFSGGDTVWFDKRPLPDSMLYRFAFEFAYSGDTTIGWVRFNSDASPYAFSPVILPEGRHRIEWRVAQDGIERFCDRNFKVKDCKKPSVACKTNVGVYLDPTQTASLSLAEALQSVYDNVTPDTQLVLGMRRVGTGSGFPFDNMGNPQDTAMFNCQDDENQFVEVWAVDKAGNLEKCTAAVFVYDTAGYCPFAPYPSICARTYWNDETIQDVKFRVSWTNSNQPTVISPIEADASGCASLTSLPPASVFTLSALKDTVSLNGVTTYDLVLISKHILALEPFDAGWKLTAADVNLSNSVTTFDIVELRKLILGLTNKLPGGTPSWRFFVDTCIVLGSPFFGNCPSAYTLPVQAISSYPPQLSFSGVKMGDVNGTASAVDSLQEAAQARGSAALLEFPDVIIKAGETLEIPLRTTAGGAWEGFQFSLKFDPDLIDIESVVSSDVFAINEENWVKQKQGLLNVSWSSGVSTRVLPGDALLRLRVKARSTAKLSDVFYLTKEARLQPEAYDETGVNHPLQLAFSSNPLSDETPATAISAPVPNPTTGSARLTMRLNTPETVSLEICDFTGKLVWHTLSTMEPGTHELEIPAAAMSQTGVYVWRVCAGNMVQSGRLIKI